MANKVDVKKTVFNKPQYIKTIDTSFDQLGVTSLSEDLENQVTVEDFFNNYNELFYDIPKKGQSNSHEFLVKTSGEYINFEEQNEIIQALQEEITALREANLELETKLIEKDTGKKINIQPIDEITENITTNAEVLKAIGANEL